MTERWGNNRVKQLWECEEGDFDAARSQILRREARDKARGIPRRSAGYRAFEAYSEAYDEGKMKWAALSDRQRAFWTFVAEMTVK